MKKELPGKYYSGHYIYYCSLGCKLVTIITQIFTCQQHLPFGDKTFHSLSLEMYFCFVLIIWTVFLGCCWFWWKRDRKPSFSWFKNITTIFWTGAEAECLTSETWQEQTVILSERVHFAGYEGGNFKIKKLLATEKKHELDLWISAKIHSLFFHFLMLDLTLRPHTHSL